MMFVENLSLTYRKKRNDTLVLKNLNLIAKRGQITAFIGKSGAGKTSLLRCIAGLEKGFSGEIRIDNTSTESNALLVAYVSQSYSLFPNLTVLENCTIALRCVLKMSSSLAIEKARSMLKEVGMQDYEDRLPRELSGGQQQRIAIARSLCLNAKIMILDEPTSALDPVNVDLLASLLRRLAENGLAIVLSSQDMRFINLVYDQVVILEEGEVIETLNRDKFDSTFSWHYPRPLST